MEKNEVKNNDKTTLFQIFYIFFFACIIGWFVEGIWTILKRHELYNHTALVFGPFDIIYGLGGIALTVILNKMKNFNNVIIFITTFVVGTILEYFASFYMEHVMGFIAWNYSSKFLNINGRVCLVYSIFWGFLGIFWVRIAMPRFLKLINKIDKPSGTKFMYIMMAFMALDFLISTAAVNRAKEFEKGVEPSNIIEKCMDKYLGVDYLNNMYNNRWGKIE